MTTTPAAPATTVLPVIVRDSLMRRTVDVFLAVLALTILGPVVAVLAFLVVLTSGRPAFFRQVRVGRNFEDFVILKLRTMRPATTPTALVSGEHDSRVTWIGSFLRKTRLDELPQLINLLRGDITLIGSRPEVPRYVADYTPQERELLRVRPGIVGPGALLFISQAHELDECADPEQYYLTNLMHPRLALDLDYLRHRSVRRDLALAWRAGMACLGRV